MLTAVFAGDKFYILERYHKEPTLDELWGEFSSYVPTRGRKEYLLSRLRELAPDADPKGPFLLTRVFIAWLLRGKGFYVRDTECLTPEE